MIYKKGSITLGIIAALAVIAGVFVGVSVDNSPNNNDNLGNGTINTLNRGEVRVSSNDTDRDYLLDKLTAGSNITLTETNDGGNETITIASSGGGGGSGGHTIQEEGTGLTQRSNLNFIGSLITAADDSGNDATTITVDTPGIDTVLADAEAMTADRAIDLGGNTLDIGDIAIRKSGSSSYIEGNGTPTVINIQTGESSGHRIGVSSSDAYVSDNSASPANGILRITGGSSAGQGAELRLRKGGTNNGNHIEIKAPDGAASNYVINLPDSAGTFALTSDITFTDVVDDTTPQLGGDLDAQGNNITGIGATGSSASAPDLSFGDGDTGFYEQSDDNFRLSLGGNDRYIFNNATFGTLVSGSVGGAIMYETASATNPVLVPDGSFDSDTGIGRSGADALSLIAGGVEGLRITESGSAATLQAGDYGTGSVTGTATYHLAVDASGNIIEEAIPGGISNVVEDTTPQLGGDLDTNGFGIGIDTNEKIYLTGEDTTYMTFPATGQIGFYQGGSVIGFFSSSGLTFNAGARLNTGVGVSATSPVLSILAVDGDTGLGTAASDQLSLIAGGVEGIRITETGSSTSLQFGDYGAGSITGTATYNLAVDSSGNVIEVATGGGGVSDLQGAFDGGETITIADTDNQTFQVDNNDTTSNPTAVDIDNAGTGDALRIDQDGNGMALRVTNNGTAEGMRFEQNAVLGSGKTAVAIYSNSAHVNGDSFLLKIEQDSASATRPIATWRNDGTGTNFELDQNGNAVALKIDSEATSNPALQIDQVDGDAHIRFEGDSANGSPSEGDFWRESTGLMYYDGTTEYNLLSGGVSADSLDFTEFADTMTIDSDTTWNLDTGQNGLVWDIADTATTGNNKGGFHIDNTDNTGHAITLLSDMNASADGPLVRWEASNTGFDKPVLEITNEGTSGSASGIRLNGPRPEIEFWETDQTSPEGAYEIRVNGDVMEIGSRNSGDSGFDYPFEFYRLADGGDFNLDTSGANVQFQGVDTLSATTLGSAVVNSSLTSVGTVTSGTWNASFAADSIDHADIADADQADTKCVYIEDPVADDDLQSIWANKTSNDFLLTEIWAESDQTVNFDLQVDDGTPADVNGSDISPAAGEAEDTSLSGDTTLAAGEELDLAVTSVSGTPTWVSICWTGNWVD